MDDALLHRLHFAFTITYHYLFPQLTMGLAPLIVFFKSMYLWKNEERYNRAAYFLGKIFAISFIFGVVTGIPMEFQFGTNWARFSGSLAELSGKPWQWKECLRFFWNLLFWDYFCLAKRKSVRNYIGFRR